MTKRKPSKKRKDRTPPPVSQPQNAPSLAGMLVLVRAYREAGGTRELFFAKLGVAWDSIDRDVSGGDVRWSESALAQQQEAMADMITGRGDYGNS